MNFNIIIHIWHFHRVLYEDKQGRTVAEFLKNVEWALARYTDAKISTENLYKVYNNRLLMEENAILDCQIVYIVCIPSQHNLNIQLSQVKKKRKNFAYIFYDRYTC